jgi:hypothetical protein
LDELKVKQKERMERKQEKEHFHEKGCDEETCMLASI